MPLRVAFNATLLLSARTGIGNYVVELGSALAKTRSIDAYTHYAYRWRHEFPTAPVPRNSRRSKTMLQRLRPLLPDRAILRHAPNLLGFRRGLRQFKIDLYHEQNYIPLSLEVPVAITIHDLSWIKSPDWQPANRVRWLSRQLPKAVEAARIIFVDSEFVKEEVVATFGVDRARVVTAHLGVRNEFAPRTATQIEATLAAHGLSFGQYVLAVGTIEPRKNIRHLLEAYERMPVAVRQRYPLVIAGAEARESSELAARLTQIKQRHIRVLGRVSQRALPDLYAGAALFAFPSLYEGFGLPPLEAMASGVPVIVSDLAPMTEVVGAAGDYLNPNDPEDTARRIVALLEDPQRRAEMRRLGLVRAAEFTWDACAAKTLAGYQWALNG